jgi:hypothetical protein
MMEQQLLWNWYFSIYLISMTFDQSEEAVFNVQLLRIYGIFEDLMEPHLLLLNITSLLGSSTNPAKKYGRICMPIERDCRIFDEIISMLTNLNAEF